MAKKSPRPGRTLLAFFVGLGIAFVLVALNGAWKPQLGLDLQGGTRITLIADGSPSKENLDTAKDIIDQRVNGSGVSEAEVTTANGTNIQVEIPGEQNSGLVQVVERQAQLRFRLVACDGSAACGQSSSPTTSTPTLPTAPTNIAPTAPTSSQSSSKPSSQPSSQPGSGATKSSTQAPSTANRAPSFLRYDSSTRARPAAAPTSPAAPSASASSTPSSSSTSTPTSRPTSSSSSSPGGTGTPSPQATDNSGTQGQPRSFDQSYHEDPTQALAFQTSPPAAAVALYNRFTCNDRGELIDKAGTTVNLPDDPTKPLVACGTVANQNPTQAYLLSPAVIEGGDVTNASAQIPQNEVNYVVAISLNGAGSSAQTAVSSKLVNTGLTFAIVLDGQVISAPTYDGVITGDSQISGNFNQQSAGDLATSLKYGALPITFDNAKTSFETIGPSLAGDQLKAGLTAGAIGLILVMLYCLLYYRGLGAVVIGSLVVAAALTYALVLLLSKTAGFTLTLPGIAGLIIAIGVTADSFIIFFERIRDEMRDGKSLRVAVESGWVRARNTTLAADAVSLLAAIVLYIFAAGVVKGFAFALGLSTLIDLAVFFWFTKPLVTYLAHYSFFRKGHRLSGLSRATLGVDHGPVARNRASVGGRA